MGLESATDHLNILEREAEYTGEDQADILRLVFVKSWRKADL
jgi:hypothetical protein